ncbi:MAG: thiamine phosphate synthase [Alphaproteobacteria bacterium]|nr:thiamine phosphate synthase [Alphaproteobacteria bacterium]
MGREPQPTKTQLYLVVELTGSEIPSDRLETLLAEFAVPSLLIQFAKNSSADTQKLRPLIINAQKHETAVLIADDAELANELRADGIHLSAKPTETPLIERYRAARQTLGANAIIGADAGHSRHDAMELSEAEADYIAFSPNRSLHDPADATAHQRELVQWWAEIFEPPVVALDVPDNATTSAFAALRADFVARTLPMGLSPADLRQWLIEVQAAITGD